MSKVFLVARAADRRKLLEALGTMGVVHLAPVDPARARAEEQIVAALDRLGRAVQVLGELRPAGAAPDLAPEAAAAEVLDVQRAQAERHNRLGRLHHQVEHLEVWGDVRLEQLREIAEARVTLRFATVPAKELAALQADCVQVIRPLRGGRVLVALADRGEPAPLPAGAVELPLPTADRPSLRAEAARIDAELRAAAQRLATLANLIPAMEAARRRLQTQSAFTVADRSGLAHEELYALQGWVPADGAEGLAAGLTARGVQAAVSTLPAAPDDSPPTLLRAPRWARPAEALLKLLGTFPGYREQDVSPAFMIALPIFAAMLIGDAGYGLLFLLVPALLRRKIAAKLGTGPVHLLMVFGLTAMAWGVITGGYFGFSPAAMIQAGGIGATVGRALSVPQLFAVEIQDKSQHTLMRISFLLAAIHLSSAHVWRAVLKFPDIRFLTNVGWAAVLWGMYGVVQHLVLNDPFSGTAYPYLVAGGLVLVVLFAHPRKYIVDGLALGALASFFPAVATFGDTVSYVRLMAICLAGSVLATRFNEMILGIGFLPVSLPLLILAHMLNIALALIALLAHGVRLNILEFSVNFGMEWSGYPYKPFAERPEEN